MGRFYGHRRRFFPRQRSQRNRFANPLHALFAKTLAKINHQRSVARTVPRELFLADEELQIGVLPDSFNRFAIGQSQSFLDDHRAQRGARRNDRRTELFAQPGVVNLLRQLPRYQPRQYDPAVLGVEVATEREVKVGKLQLLMILAAVHPSHRSAKKTRRPSDAPRRCRSQSRKRFKPIPTKPARPTTTE